MSLSQLERQMVLTPSGVRTITAQDGGALREIGPCYCPWLLDASGLEEGKLPMVRSVQLLLQLIAMTGCALALASTPAVGQSAQQHIHEMGHTVMPFDLNKTTHIFRMTDSGGVQSVVVKDAKDKDQIGPIRQHLRHEAEAFQRGDYADPMSIHGAAMPGVSELASHHAEITVSYSDMPLGAALTFMTPDQHLVTAIHRWFGAQLSEHGADARAE